MNRQLIETYTDCILKYSDIENIEILKHLMQIVYMENDNNPLKRFVLIDKLAQITKMDFNDKVKIIIQNILDEGLAGNIYVHNKNNDTYNMSNDKFEEVCKYMERVLNNKSKFHNDFTQFIIEKNNRHAFLNDNEISIVKDNIELILNTYFYENGIYIFKKIKSLDLDNYLSDDDELKKVVYKVLEKHNIDIYGLTELHRTISDFLLQLDSEHIDYIIQLLQKTVFVKLINTINVNSDKSVLAERVFYIDTNVLIALLFDNHPKNKEVDFIIKTCRDLGIILKVTEKTINEYKRQFEYISEIDKKLSDALLYSSPKLMKVISSQDIDNDIYEYYLNNLSSFKSFSSFVETYCNNVYTFLNLYKIEAENIPEEVYDTYAQKKEYSILFEELKLAKSRDYYTPNDLVVEHDLQHLYFISDVRDKTNDVIDSIGYKNWFLTLEKKIEKFRYINKNIFINPLWMTIDELYDLLLPYFIDKTETGEEFLKYQFSTKIGLYDNHDNTLKLDVLSCVFDSGIDIEKFEKLDNREATELIYNIQANSNVQKLCKTIKDDNDGRNTADEELKACIQYIIEEKNKEIEKSSEKNQIRLLAQELEKKEIENEQLRKFKENYERQQLQQSQKKISAFERFMRFLLELLGLNKSDDIDKSV